MSALTTHVLDTASGKPARGVKIALYGLDGARELLSSAMTNADGRTDEAMLSGGRFKPGKYELIFHVGDYFSAAGFDLPSPKFIDQVVVRFGISDGQAHYHVPLLVSPYGYSTYRGS